jgi:hypothetical protein
MADSPLSEINWDNLEGQSLITAMNLLQLAFSERVNVAANLGFYRHFGNSSRVLRTFPFFDNSPDVGKPNWPAMWGRQVPNLGWDTALANYLSITKLNNVLGTGILGLGFRYEDVQLDQDTLLTDVGIPLTGNRATEYPRMDIINTENIKIWYDMITSLKYIFVDGARGGAGSNGQSKFLSSYSEGIFKPDGDTEFPNNPFVGQYFVSYDGVFGPPFSQLATDWPQIWTGPRTKRLISGSNPSFKVRYDYQNGSSALVMAMNTYSRFDTSDFDAIGHSGEPQGIRTYGSFNGSPQGAAGQAWMASNGYDRYKIIQLPSATRTVLAGNQVERNIPIPPPTLPSHEPTIDLSVTTNHGTYELWDAEGGFEFYSPTP